jgi:hypothetical protein
MILASKEATSMPDARRLRALYSVKKNGKSDVQYEYVKLTAFQGIPGPITATSTPNQGLTPNNNILMFSVRCYPFN